MSVTNVWKIPEKNEYAVITQKVLKIDGKEIKFDIHFLGRNGEERSEPIAEYRNLGLPLSSFGNPIYLSREELLKDLSASGVKPEDIEKLKPKL